MFESLTQRTPKIIDFGEYRKYALSIPLVNIGGKNCVLFEVRARSLAHQPGEVCLPGGHVEPEEDFRTAAVRETAEELCISQGDIQVIAPMDMYLSPSGQMIMPYLVRLLNYHGSFSRQEVDEIFYVPVDFFLKNVPRGYKNHIFTKPDDDFPEDAVPGGKKYPWRSGWSLVYFYPETCGHRIWGLTAKIMKSAAEIMREAIENEQ
ncbi:MAG TPA: CoA pyrophosphatase [Candidatus Scybalocola faecigallinarum]|uniref:CoA pyrophosphatase n=1 Tax=Candidatus Scybalocola faecigallinarum TaxID=2840941 RepID=A0A9D1F7P1_9FIRM|nr:CoA pyrophosphatase [Candidatus Scybalocola faecigallinarum]